jgi:hypothetical protein
VDNGIAMTGEFHGVTKGILAFFLKKPDSFCSWCGYAMGEV